MVLRLSSFKADVLAVSPLPVVSATVPGSPVAGMEWFNTNDGRLYIYTGTAWAEVSSNNVNVATGARPGIVQPGAGLSVTSLGLLNTSGAEVGRNRVINPNFGITQRGGGPFTGNAAWTVDRWRIYSPGGGTRSVTSLGLTDTDRSQIGDEEATIGINYVFTGTSGAADLEQFYSYLENLRRFTGRTWTFSFWARATAANVNLGFSLFSSFGTGGSPSAGLYSNGRLFALTTTWTRYEVSCAVPSSAGKTFGTVGDDALMLAFAMTSGATTSAAFGGLGVQSGTIQMTGLQFEPGIYSSPLEKRPVALEAILCFRYLQNFAQIIHGGYGPTGGSYYNSFTLPVYMRTTPTVTISNASYSNVSSSTLNVAYPNQVRIGSTILSTGGGYGSFDMLCSAEL